MEVIQTTAKMQNAQLSGTADAGSAQSAQNSVRTEAIHKAAAEAKAQRSELDANTTGKIESQQDMERLVEKLNAALDPFRTSLKFGFDNSSDDFYVSVIETETNKMIRRFPAEKAFDVLPRIQELNGILFDEKG